MPDHGRTELRGSLACAAQAAGAGLWRRRRGLTRDAGAPGCVASEAAGWWRWWERGEARSRRVTEAKEVEKGIS